MHSISRKLSSVFRETRSESASREDADDEYVTHRFNDMIKGISRKLAATNIYYIKLFQAIAYSSDIVNEELTSFFRDYTDSVAFTPSEYNTSDIADLIEYAKSVGYTLQIPSLIPILSSISNFKYLVALLNLFPSLRYLHLNDIYSEQRTMMLEQINFERETACILNMSDTCKDARCIQIPMVYSEFTAKFPNIIVMERLIGQTLDQLDDEVKDHYCRSLARGLVKTVFIDGLYHCDLHPGNTIFIKDNETETYKIGLIDFGIVDRVSAQEQEVTFELFRSIVKKDADTAVRTLMAHYTEPYDASVIADKNNPEILNELREYIESMLGTVVTCFSAENLCFINKLLIKHNLKVARSFTKFELSLSVCDNLCKKLAVKRSYMSHLNEIMADAFE